MLCGFATFRAESLWLSVKPSTLLAATPPEAKPLLFLRSERKARGFPHGTRQSRNQLIADEYGSRVSKGHKTQRGSGEIELTIYNEGV